MHPIFPSVFNWSFLKILYAFFSFISEQWNRKGPPFMEEITTAFCPYISTAYRRKHWSQIERKDSWEMAALACDSGEVKAIPLPATCFFYDPRKFPVFQWRRGKVVFSHFARQRIWRLWTRDVCHKMTKAQSIAYLLWLLQQDYPK